MLRNATRFLLGSRIVLSHLPPCAKRKLGVAFDLIYAAFVRLNRGIVSNG